MGGPLRRGLWRLVRPTYHTVLIFFYQHQQSTLDEILFHQVRQ